MHLLLKFQRYTPLRDNRTKLAPKSCAHVEGIQSTIQSNIYTHTYRHTRKSAHACARPNPHTRSHKSSHIASTGSKGRNGGHNVFSHIFFFLDHTRTRVNIFPTRKHARTLARNPSRPPPPTRSLPFTPCSPHISVRHLPPGQSSRMRRQAKE